MSGKRDAALHDIVQQCCDKAVQAQWIAANIRAFTQAYVRYDIIRAGSSACENFRPTRPFVRKYDF